MTVPTDLILGLFNVFAPIVRDVIAEHQKTHNGALPSDAEMLAQFNAHIDKYLAEGAAWRAAHAKVPKSL